MLEPSEWIIAVTLCQKYPTYSKILDRYLPSPFGDLYLLSFRISATFSDIQRHSAHGNVPKHKLLTISRDLSHTAPGPALPTHHSAPEQSWAHHRFASTWPREMGRELSGITSGSHQQRPASQWVTWIVFQCQNLWAAKRPGETWVQIEHATSV